MADRYDDIDWGPQLRIGIWVAQGILAAFCVTVGLPMLVQPQALPAGMGFDFAAALPDLAVRVLGVAYLLLALGLLLPSALRWRPVLTPLSAALLAMVQVAMLVVHGLRGELQATLSIDLMLLLMAGAVAWARLRYAPIGPR